MRGQRHTGQELKTEKYGITVLFSRGVSNILFETSLPFDAAQCKHKVNKVASFVLKCSVEWSTNKDHYHVNMDSEATDVPELLFTGVLISP